MATRGTNTQAEGLQALMKSITEMKAYPDADISFLIGIETTILQKLREGFDNMAGQLPPPPGNAVEMGQGGGDPMAAMAGAGGGGMPPMPMPMGGGGGGGVAAGLPGPGGPMPSAPGPRFSPDIMRRALRGGGIQGG